MTDRPLPLLTVTFHGGIADGGTLPLTSFKRTTDALQRTVTRIAAVTVTGMPTRRMGDIPLPLRRATEFAVGTPQVGSLAVALTSAPHTDDRLVRQTVTRLFMGLAQLREHRGRQVLPDAFDRRVLMELRTLHRVVGDDVHTVSLSSRGFEFVADDETRDTFERLLTEPLLTSHDLVGQLDRGPRGLLLRIDDDAVVEVASPEAEHLSSLVGNSVTLHGRGELMPGSDIPERFTVEYATPGRPQLALDLPIVMERRLPPEAEGRPRRRKLWRDRAQFERFRTELARRRS